MNASLRAQQDRLHALGLYPSPGDGVPGPATERAINAVIALAEKAAGIKVPVWPTLPAAYGWLRTTSGLPLIVHEGLKLLGTVEVKGAVSSSIIMGWRDELNAAGEKIVGYSSDAVPWCGLYAAIVVLRAKKDPVTDPLWAANWAKWGVDADPSKSAAPVKRAMLGDIVTYSRPGGNHVAVWIARDAAGYDHVLGGNQGDAVNIMRISASRRTSVRRAPYNVQPAAVKEYVVAASGAISRNEA